LNTKIGRKNGAWRCSFSLYFKKLGDADNFELGDADNFELGDADRFQFGARACENVSQVQQKARQRLLPKEVEAGDERRKPLTPASTTASFHKKEAISA